MDCTLLLKGGHIVDPSQGLDAIADIALAGDRILAIASDLSALNPLRIENVSGLLVVPGLIDVHTHVFPGVTALGLDPDATSLAKGATTVLDAGSAGAANIEGFRRFIVSRAHTRIRALLNIASIGMPFSGVAAAELGWKPLIDTEAALSAIASHRDLIVGLKVRMTRYIVKDTGAHALYAALDVSQRAGLPIMVHIGDSPLPVSEIFDLLRPGDIVTHMYTAFAGLETDDAGKTWRRRPDVTRGGGISILDADGHILPAALRARERGVLMDVGHGAGSFSFEVCRRAVELGFVPDTIGTDLHTGSINGPVYDLPTLLSRFLCLGMPLSAVIAACTITPARLLGLADEIGTLRPGAAGDIAVLELQRGRFAYHDSIGAIYHGEQRLAPLLTIRAGKVVARNGNLIPCQ